MTSYVLVGVPMYRRNMLPPSLGSKWVGRECSQMEACPTDNFYHSSHFNPEKVVACFSEIFVNITWRLQPEYSMLWKQMLCIVHIDNSCYKSLTQRHWERLPTFSVIHIISFTPLCKRNSVTWVAIYTWNHDESVPHFIIRREWGWGGTLQTQKFYTDFRAQLNVPTLLSLCSHKKKSIMQKGDGHKNNNDDDDWPPPTPLPSILW
jgi:hypothetical protein